MTKEQIQNSKDSELMTQVLSWIASYAIENDMSPNETIKTVAENMLDLLKIATFENWEKKTLPSVISTSDDCVSRKQAKMDVIPNSLYTSEQVIALLDNLSSVTPTHGTCKDCKYNVKGRRTTTMCDIGHRFYMREPSTFYCTDFKKRCDEND